MRTIGLLLVALFGASCVPPSCFNRFLLPYPKVEHFATIRTYSQPMAEGGTGKVHDWFERGSTMHVDERGSIEVWRGHSEPMRCPIASEEDLDAVSRQWKPVLDWLVDPRVHLRFMADPEMEQEDWRPDGPLLELSFGSTTGENVSLYLDGKKDLPNHLDAAVMETLRLFCINSRLAEKYLRRDLPPEIAGRLDCQR